MSGVTYDLFKEMHARPRCDLINPFLLIIHFPSSVAHCHFQKKQSLHIVLLIKLEKHSLKYNLSSFQKS